MPDVRTGVGANGAAGGVSRAAISFPERDVVHLDIAAFAVAVERVREPRLRARPVVVAPPTPRGVVMAASFEARRAGIGRGMPVMRARRVCRDVIVVTPDELEPGTVELAVLVDGGERLRVPAPPFDWEAARMLAAAGTSLRPGDVLAGPAGARLDGVAGRVEVAGSGIGLLDHAAG